MKKIIIILITTVLLILSSCSSAPKTMDAFYNKYKADNNAVEINLNGFMTKVATLFAGASMYSKNSNDKDLEKLRPFIKKIRGLKVMNLELTNDKAKNAKSDLISLMKNENFEELLSTSKDNNLTKIAIIRDSGNRNEFVIANINENEINIINFKSNLTDENIAELMSTFNKDYSTVEF